MKNNKSLLYLIIVLLVVIFGVILFIVLSPKSENNRDNTNIKSNTNISQSTIKSVTSLYFIKEGQLILVGKGDTKVIYKGPLTHLFATTEKGTVWVGNAVEVKNEFDNALSPIYTLNIIEIDPKSGNVIQEHTFNKVNTVMYGPKSKRFVLIHQKNNSLSDSWLTPITILDSKGKVIEEFQEDNIVGFKGNELDDGTILLEKKRDNYKKEAFLALLNSGEHEIRIYQLPDLADSIIFHNKIPLVILSDPTSDNVVKGRIYRIDGEHPTLFVDLSNVGSVNRIFDYKDKTYLIASIVKDPDNWGPCQRLFRIEGTQAVQVVGNVTFAFPGTEGKFIYGEPIDSCQHVRIWETDEDGKNATLILDDYHTIWHSPPLVVNK